MIKKLSSLLSGEEVYVVGGAVRDRLLKRPIYDLDLVIKRNPAQMGRQIAKALKGSAFPLDEERGITRVTVPKLGNIDIALKQGATFEKDLERRDFSINAMSIPLKDWFGSQWRRKIIDHYSGQKDLKKKTIRALSPSALKDDPLRMLRAFRIATELQFKIAPATLKAIQTNRKKITSSAPERIHEELLKLFAINPCYSYVKDMEKSGLLEIIFPESKKLRSTAPDYYGKGGVLKHVLSSILEFELIQKNLRSLFSKHHKKLSDYLNQETMGHPRFAHLKWSLLLHDIGKPGTAEMIDGRLRFFNHEHVGADMIPKIAPRYRWSNDETKLHARMVSNHMRPGNLANHAPVSDRAIHRFFRDLGDDALAMLLVSLADHLTYLTPRQKKRRNSAHEVTTKKMINRFFETPQRVLPPRIITGHDIMKKFDLDPSPIIGALLKEVMEAQSEGKIKTKKQGLDFLKKKIKKLK